MVDTWMYWGIKNKLQTESGLKVYLTKWQFDSAEHAFDGTVPKLRIVVMTSTWCHFPMSTPNAASLMVLVALSFLPVTPESSRRITRVESCDYSIQVPTESSRSNTMVERFEKVR